MLNANASFLQILELSPVCERLSQENFTLKNTNKANRSTFLCEVNKNVLTGMSRQKKQEKNENTLGLVTQSLS